MESAPYVGIRDWTIKVNWCIEPEKQCTSSSDSHEVTELKFG